MGEARCSRAGASGARTIHRQAAGTFFFHLSVHGIPCRKTVVGHKWSTTSHTDEVRGNVLLASMPRTCLVVVSTRRHILHPRRAAPLKVRWRVRDNSAHLRVTMTIRATVSVSNINGATNATRTLSRRESWPNIDNSSQRNLNRVLCSSTLLLLFTYKGLSKKGIKLWAFFGSAGQLLGGRGRGP